MNIKHLAEKIKAYALKNALAHEGKAQAGAVISALFVEGLKKEHVKEIMPKVQAALNEVNSMNTPEQRILLEKLKGYIHEREARKEGELPELPDAKKGGVIMRFAPSPSGPLHIGHAATGCLSALYVKKYGGVFYVRIEDTNPENIYPLAYKMISNEAKWLFGKETKIIVQSDRMNIYYDYINRLLQKNLVYVCTCEAEKFKKLIERKKACPCRSQAKKQNLELWGRMLSNDKKSQLKEGEAVVRFKSNINDPNPAFRDFPLARINEAKHPCQENKYRVWPLMNLAVAVDDIETKITHIIRAKDHRDNAHRQELIFKALGRKYPWSAFLGRYHFKDMELSSTQMRKAIEAGKYSGWDDTRLPTIASLKKQGYSPQAFWGLAIRVGLSENDKILDKNEYLNLLKYFNEQKKMDFNI